MKLLLDTHLLLWMAQRSPRLSAAALKLTGDPDNELLFSVASLWEFGIKYEKVPDQFDISPIELREGLIENGYFELNITGMHALSISRLPTLHGDPFDRILITQAMVEGITLVTTDEVVARYPGPIRKV
jgi:PIN domain nuclease of toxin-antitoxin system